MIRYDDIEELVRSYNPSADFNLLRKAVLYSAKVHAGQVRSSGEPYLSHPLSVAYILAEMRLDVKTIAAGLLHDVIEDTAVSREELEEEFGEEIASIVDGVTKIGKVSYPRFEQQIYNLRRILIAMAKDLRVIFVKLADRLHNMRTLNYLPEEKQKRIAEETLQIYAPIAHRLGLGKIKAELEDLSFRYLYPKEYFQLEAKIEAVRDELERKLERMSSQIKKILEERGIKATIQRRVKRLYSIFRKINRKNIDLDQVFDLLALRIITDTESRCYEILGLIHKHWTPLEGRFRDWISKPKSNGYRSLHTTIITREGDKYEIQIRTWQMHRDAEYGIAAHWSYKEGKPVDDYFLSMSWIKNLADFLQETEEEPPYEFMEHLKLELYPDEIYVFTPKGDIITLPKGATPVDFAYAVHTEIGNHCAGAKINGKLAPLKTQLKTGDVVEIITSPSASPSRDWLSFVKTSKAKSKIKSWFRKIEKVEILNEGKKKWERFLRSIEPTLGFKIEEEDLIKRLNRLSIPSMDQLFYSIGTGTVKLNFALIKKLFPEKFRKEEQKKKPGVRGVPKIRVEGLDGLEVSIAKCCKPVKGIPIIAYISRSGIKIHSTSCPYYLSGMFDPQRIKKAEWVEDNSVQEVSLLLKVTDAPGTLQQVLGKISESKINISFITGKSLGDGTAEVELTVEVRNAEELERIKKELEKIRDVFQVILV